jgi:DNA-directed RNA polymerase subunit K/omega
MDEETPRNSRECQNLYELIMVAAKEARRLNSYARNRNIQLKTRITTEAIRRATKEGIRYTFTKRERELDSRDAPLSPFDLSDDGGA